MLAAHLPSFDEFYPPEPPDARSGLSLVPPPESTESAPVVAPSTRLRQPALSLLHELAEQRIAGLLRLREFVRHRHGVNFDLFLREVRSAEKRARSDIRDDENLLKEARESQRKVTREHPTLRRAISEYSKIVSGIEEVKGLDEHIRQALGECRRDLEGLRRDRLAKYEDEWLAYIESLVGGEHDTLVVPLRKFWDWISKKLWAPEGSPFDDGFLMTWDYYDHRLQVILSPDGTYDWSYYNRATEEYWSEENLITGHYTDALQVKIRELTRA